MPVLAREGGTPRSIELPPPMHVGARPIWDALARRRTIREIAATPLSLVELSTLLWAAFGVNRARGPFGAPGRTAAFASNSQEIDLYVALQDAAYRYEAVQRRLEFVTSGDLRTEAMDHRQGMASKAPVQLIYVVDTDRLTRTKGFDEPGLHDPEVQKAYYFVDTGLIAGNVYLFAAAYGLASWFHNCERDRLAKRLALAPSQQALFAHSIGWPVQAEGGWS